MDLKRRTCRLVALSYPQDAAGGVILRQFLTIFSSLCSRVSLVTDSDRYEGVEGILVESPRKPGFVYHFRYQVRVAKALIQCRKSWDVAAFLVGGIGMLVPLMMTRVLGKKSFLVVT